MLRKLQALWPYVRRQKCWWALIAGLTLLCSAGSLLQPWPMKVLVDHVLGSAPVPERLRSALGVFWMTPNPAVLLALAALGGLGLFLFNSAFDVALSRAWTVAGQRMVCDVADDLFGRLQRRSLLFHSRSSVGDSLSRITGDCWAVHQVVDPLLFAPGHALLMLAGMIALMWQLDAGLTLLSLAVVPFMIAASWLVGKPLRAVAKARRQIESSLQSHVQQTLSGIPVVQAFVQEDRQQRRFQQFALAAIRAQARSSLLGSLNGLATGLITVLGTGVVLWSGSRRVVDGQLTVGGLLVFLSYLGSMQSQVKVLAGIYPALQTASAGVDRVLEVLEREPEIADRRGAVALRPVQGRLQMDRVTFGYEPGRPVLRGVSMEVEPGETVAIVGPTGAGKSTLAGLVPRFYDPWEGQVTVDGHEVRGVQLKSLRRQVAWVLQEPFLFPMSIAENIAYGRPRATRAQIEEAAVAANAHEFITRLPEGYETVLGGRGATLSGGERQRLAIARALLKDAPILILDEPTSALDAETEHLVVEALERLAAGRTTLIIAHRLSTIRRADRIVVLDRGCIVESGTHEQLLSLGRHYARIHGLQSGLPKPVAATAG